MKCLTTARTVHGFFRPWTILNAPSHAGTLSQGPGPPLQRRVFTGTQLL